MAELADALASGASSRKGVEVQILSGAFFLIMRRGGRARFKAPVSKTGSRVIGTGVQISPSPPSSKMNKRLYIIFTIIFLICLIVLQTLFAPPIKGTTPILLTKEKIAGLSHSIPIIIIGLIYASLFIAGIALLIIFGIRKLNDKPVIETPGAKDFPIPTPDKLPKLFFFIVLYTLVIYILSITILHSQWKPKSIVLSVISNFTLQLGSISIMLYFFSRKSLGFNKNNAHILDLFKVYIAIIPILLSTLLLNSLILDSIGIKPTVNPAIGLFIALKNKLLIFVLVLEVIILAPIVEEIFFRGIIYKVLRSRFSFMLSALFTSLLFAAIHRVPSNILPLFVISFSLCYTYEKTKSIYSPIIFHSIHNTLSITFLLILKNVL